LSETPRVHHAETVIRQFRASGGVNSLLMKDFSLSSAQGIGGAWLRPSTPFDERYGQW